MDLGEIGLETLALLVDGNGLIEAAKVAESVAKIVVGLDEVGLVLEGIPVTGDRLLEPAALGQDDAEIVVRPP